MPAEESDGGGDADAFNAEVLKQSEVPMPGLHETIRDWITPLLADKRQKEKVAVGIGKLHSTSRAKQRWDMIRRLCENKCDYKKTLARLHEGESSGVIPVYRHDIEMQTRFHSIPRPPCVCKNRQCGMECKCATCVCTCASSYRRYFASNQDPTIRDKKPLRQEKIPAAKLVQAFQLFLSDWLIDKIKKDSKDILDLFEEVFANLPQKIRIEAQLRECSSKNSAILEEDGADMKAGFELIFEAAKDMLPVHDLETLPVNGELNMVITNLEHMFGAGNVDDTVFKKLCAELSTDKYGIDTTLEALKSILQSHKIGPLRDIDMHVIRRQEYMLKSDIVARASDNFAEVFYTHHRVNSHATHQKLLERKMTFQKPKLSADVVLTSCVGHMHSCLAELHSVQGDISEDMTSRPNIEKLINFVSVLRKLLSNTEGFEIIGMWISNLQSLVVHTDKMVQTYQKVKERNDCLLVFEPREGTEKNKVDQQFADQARMSSELQGRFLSRSTALDEMPRAWESTLVELTSKLGNFQAIFSVEILTVLLEALQELLSEQEPAHVCMPLEVPDESSPVPCTWTQATPHKGRREPTAAAAGAPAQKRKREAMPAAAGALAQKRQREAMPAAADARAQKRRREATQAAADAPAQKRRRATLPVAADPAGSSGCSLRRSTRLRRPPKRNA